jgi:hypothetical protein
VTDDRAAVQATINAALTAGGRVVFFPTGTYPCVVTGGISTFLLRDTDSSKLLFLGEGRAIHVTMAGNGASTDRRLFDIKTGCKYIGFKSLKLSSTLTNEHEEQHLIHFECAPSSTDPETGRAFIIDCYFGHTRGAAIRFLGSDTKRVKNVLVKRCVFQMEHTPSSRSALSFQRSADEVTIDACYTSGASPIDFKSSDLGSTVQHRVTRNHFVGKVTLSGNGAGQEHQRSIFSNNTVVGTLSGGDVEQLVVAKNIVDASVVGAFGVGTIEFIERVHDVVIADNICYHSGDTNTVLVVSVEHHTVGENRNVIIGGSMIVNDNNVTDGGTLSLRAVSGATVHGNMLMNKVNTASKGWTVRVEATTEAVMDNVVTENLGIGTNQTLIHGISGGNGNFTASDNLMRNINNGITFGGTVLEQYSACRNVLVSSITAVRLSGGVPTYIAVESGTLKGPTIFDLRVAPELVVPAAIGSIGLRSSGGGAGTTFYVKESGNGLSTGWTAK